MTLQPDDVNDARFGSPRRRDNYDMGQVHDYLDVVEAVLGQWTTRVAALRTHNDELRAALADGRSAGPATEDVRRAILGPDPLDADSLTEVTFEVVRGHHGYDRAHVENFMDEVRASVLELRRRLEDLRSEHRLLQDQFPPEARLDYRPAPLPQQRRSSARAGRQKVRTWRARLFDRFG